MKIKRTPLLISLSFIIFFATIFYVYLSSNLWDYDFWWHISTGRYIVQNGSLPESDPFSYTSELAENKNRHPERESFILKQYWLAQVIFYLIFENTGNKGIIIFKAGIILLTVFLVFWGLHRKKVQFYILFIFTYVAYRETFGFSGERPVLFTILFSVAAFILLDEFKDNKGWRLLLLLPLMLLWANMHGGFVLGDMLIIAFLTGETVKLLLRKSTYTREELLRFYLISVSAISISFINPNGITAFFITFSSKYKIFTEGVQEYQPPFFLYMNKLSTIEYGYIAMVLLFPIILIIRKKTMDLTYIILLSALCYISLSSMRFTVYYVTIGAIILGYELNAIIERLFSNRLSFEAREKLNNVFVLFILFSSIGYLGVIRLDSLKFRQAEWFSVPRGGADFIEKNRLKGRIFNDFGSGGYLTWRLYPFKKTFIDTRAINHILMREYNFIMNAYYSKTRMEVSEDIKKKENKKTELWEGLLDHYNINVIFVTPLDVFGSTARLLFRLADSENWVPVYNDQLGIIFIRNSKYNSDIIDRFRRTKDDVYNTIILQASFRAGGFKQNPLYFISLGEAFYKIGRLEDSLKAYKYALKRQSNPLVQERIKKIGSEIKEKGKLMDLPKEKTTKNINTEETAEINKFVL